MPAKVFGDYDGQALDAEYNNRAKVADAAAWLERYARESARARAELPCRLDVAYGPSPEETLDIFPAPGAPRRARSSARSGARRGWGSSGGSARSAKWTSS